MHNMLPIFMWGILTKYAVNVAIYAVHFEILPHDIYAYTTNMIFIYFTRLKVNIISQKLSHILKKNGIGNSKSLNLLKLNDLYNMKGFLLYKKNKQMQTPLFIQNALTQNNTVHSYNTRQSLDIHVNCTKNNYGKLTINYKMHNLMKQIPTHIKDSSQQITSTKRKLKNILIKNYSYHCNIQHCYICSS